jgi:hypothetical protein
MRNKKKRVRVLKEINHKDRRLILLDFQVMTGPDVMEKWNITKNTLHHINYCHGKSHALVNGQYYKDLLNGEVHPTVEMIRGLKKKGYTSGDVSECLKIPLDIVNKNW